MKDKKARLRGDNLLGFFLLLPIGIVIFGLVAYPLASALWMSLNEKMVGGIPKFVGLRHYAFLLRDDIFRTTVINNFVTPSVASASNWRWESRSPFSSIRLSEEETW